MDNNNSLEKSHSKWSNFKLTCLCVLITLSISSLWILVCFKDFFRFIHLVIVGFVSIAILTLSIIVLKNFKR